ncbi:MAG: hypothetical protein HQ513_03950 [Rhodospirillales bacterium]|nr:hypothetical protein [Rhodospirillales bacterium]
MATGMEIRAQIDGDIVEGLLLLNGGGAVAVLALLPSIIGKSDFASLSQAVLWALLFFQFGLVSAVIHNRFRRLCSLKHERHQYNPPSGIILGIDLRRPTVCFFSIVLLWTSLILFVGAGLIVFWGGFRTL